MTDNDAFAVVERPATHPEEMKAVVRAGFGTLSFEATARITPAGMIAVGLSTAAILLACAAILRARR